MFIGFQAVAATSTLKNVGSLTIPAGATGAQIQSETAPVRFTMDGSSFNPTSTVGMLLKLTDMPREYLIEDIRRIRFCRDGSSDGVLNIHYFAGRNI